MHRAGKSSLLKLIANVLSGNDIEHYDLNIVGEAESPYLYEIRSTNGILVGANIFIEMRRHNLHKVRILDTPGLASTYDIEQDEAHKESIVRYIEQHVDSVSAVLILVDLVSQKAPFGSDYTLSILSATFPKTLVNNIAFMFTNVQNRDLSQKQILGPLKSSPVFLLDNPIVQQRGFKDPNMMKMVKDREQRALEMLVELFNWLDGLEPHPTTEITSLYEIYQNIEVKTTSIFDLRVEIDRLTIALKRYSAVSLSLLLSSGTRISCPLGAGNGCFFRLRDDGQHTRLEAATHDHSQN
jgi:hypothetical protein